MPFKVSRDKLVPAEAIQELARGSYEHFALRLDESIAEQAKLFTGDHDSNVARIATFKDRVVVGTGDGRYFSAHYEDVDGRIDFSIPEQLDVPVVDSLNVREYEEDALDKIVTSLMIGEKAISKDQILALMNIKESVDDNASDLATLVYDIVSSNGAWKTAYRKNVGEIRSQLGQVAESIDKSAVAIKYAPLYDGSIVEEKFPMYLSPARRDLAVLADRLSKVETKTESAYLPVAENVNKLDDEDRLTVEQLVSFADGLVEEVHDLREHVKIAIENENCAMCLGQIHDAIAGSLSDYEMASSFVEHLAARLTEAA